MRSKASFLLVYVLCVELVVVAAWILGTEPFCLLLPPNRRSVANDVSTLSAMVVIATVFGVGAKRRPVASLIGAILASGFLDFATRSSERTYPPPVFLPFIWISWFQGRLAYWVVRLFKFVYHLITRPAKPSPDGATGPIPSTSPRD